MRSVIGIDPGVGGGIFQITIGTDGIKASEFSIMPTIERNGKRYVDPNGFLDLMPTISRPVVWIEDVHAMPKNGSVSMFNFGAGWGLVRGICMGRGLDVRLVSPQKWQNTVLPSPGMENEIATNLWPKLDFPRTPHSKKLHSGIIDACLIAEYGLLMEVAYDTSTENRDAGSGTSMGKVAPAGDPKRKPKGPTRKLRG